jgi:hypothetical protein
MRWLVLLALVGCGSTEEPEPRITDQSGGEFLLVDGEIHRIAAVSPWYPPCDDNSGAYILRVDRFEHVMGVCSDHGSGGWSRVLVCEEDDDCAEHPCHAGFCQEDGAGMPTRGDMQSLCYGERDRYAPLLFDTQLDREIDEACPTSGEPCISIPTGCPDPT